MFLTVNEQDMNLKNPLGLQMKTYFRFFVYFNTSGTIGKLIKVVNSLIHYSV